jgi:hypothetical protein
MASLLMCDWLKKAQNLVLTGPVAPAKPMLLAHSVIKPA